MVAITLILIFFTTITIVGIFLIKDRLYPQKYDKVVNAVLLIVLVIQVIGLFAIVFYELEMLGGFL